MTKKKETKSRNEYWRNYHRETYKSVNIYIKKNEKEVLKELDKHKNKSEYLINLIKEDINR